MALNGYACELLVEHTAAWDLLMDQADQAKKDLRNGPGEATLERLAEAGLMTGREIFLFGGQTSPAVEYEPEDDWTPQQVSAWWGSLAPNQQDFLQAEHSDDLRNLNGVPVVVRDELNRERLERELALGRISGDHTIRNLEHIEEALKEDDTFLIQFEPYSGWGGEAAISTGNPDLADNVSTMVPGMLNSMGSMGLPIERSIAIHEQMEAIDPGAEHASIVWLGYDAPPWGGFEADKAASSLASFQEGLRASHQGNQPSNNSVLGHSFGAFIAGAADNPEIGGGLDADSLTLIGGPGASVDNISELSMDPDNIHVIEGDDDKINWRDNFGFTDYHYGEPLANDEFREDPNSSGELLGHHLDPDRETGHSEYFEDEETLRYIADVATGRR